jgi:hypothetical protein
MATARQNTPGEMSTPTIILLILVIIFIPVVGQFIVSYFVLTDRLSFTARLLWLIAVWVLPFLGPLLYLLVGQRRNRLI